jgi:hypothetical protein
MVHSVATTIQKKSRRLWRNEERKAVMFLFGMNFGHLKELVEEIESKSVLNRRHLYQSQSS